MLVQMPCMNPDPVSKLLPFMMASMATTTGMERHDTVFSLLAEAPLLRPSSRAHHLCTHSGEQSKLFNPLEVCIDLILEPFCLQSNVGTLLALEVVFSTNSCW
jgi:hypothetical protein